jgi:flagellar biosynthesis/type III secretory pathway protein FliH
MMSSYRRIPRNKVKISPKKIVQDEQHVLEEDEFKEKSLDTYLRLSRQRIQEEESKAKEEIEEKKKEWLESFQEQVKREAIDLAKEEIMHEYEEKVKEATLFYEEANKYKQNLYKETEKIKQEYIRHHEKEIIDLVLEVSKKLIEKQCEDKEVLQQLLEKTLESVALEAKKLFVTVHPSTRKRLIDMEDDGLIQFYIDPSLNPIDFVVETDREFIDARLEEKLNVLRNQIAKGGQEWM